MRTQGKIVTWNDERGFGFIAPKMGGDQVFVHIKAFPSGTSRPTVGAEVTYCCTEDAQGRLRAEKVKIVGVAYSMGAASKAFIFSMGFLAFVAVVSFIGMLPAAIFWLYFIMSLLTFGMYARDKSAARESAQRAPEKLSTHFLCWEVGRVRYMHSNYYVTNQVKCHFVLCSG